MIWRENLKETAPVLHRSYPRVLERINLMWGSDECVEELCQIIEFQPTPERPDRAGFSWDAMSELQTLLALHLEEFPELESELSRRTNDVWNPL